MCFVPQESNCLYMYYLYSSLDWHPNNVLIASGSSDFKARYILLLKVPVGIVM